MKSADRSSAGLAFGTRVALLLLVLCFSSPHAVAQYYDPPDDPSTYTWVRNAAVDADPANDGDFNFPVAMADPTIMQLQDAAGVTWFFVTGSCPGEKFANFRIYRSRDLMNWEAHSWVFDPALRHPTQNANQDYLSITNAGATRKFMHLWSPHLYYDPNNGDGVIYLAFSATEVWDNDLDDDYVPDSNLGQGGSTDPDNTNLEFSQEQVTCFVAWTEKSRFLTGGSTYWVSQAFRPFMPQWYTYRMNNGTVYRRDGGWAQGQASGDGYASIPCTGITSDGAWDFSGDPVGDRRANRTGVYGDAWKLQGGESPRGFHWYAIGPRAWMADGPQAFFDPLNDDRPWITWSWAQRSGNLYDGANVAAFPLVRSGHAGAGFRNADALYDNPNFAPPYQTQPLQLFFAHTTYNSMYGRLASGVMGYIPNGKIVPNCDGTGEPVEAVIRPAGVTCGAFNNDYPHTPLGGIVEAQDIFYRGGRYYLLASRNWWNQPSYQIVYRMSELNADSVEDMHIPWDWNSPVVNVPEYVLVASDWVEGPLGGSRNGQCTTSYGHSQYFTAYGREYIIFHQWNTEEAPPP